MEFATKYENHLYNITPHKGISNNIPDEVFFNKPDNFKYIRIFGCSIIFYH